MPMIRILFLASAMFLLPLAHAECKSAALQDRLRYDVCLNERLDSRGLPYAVSLKLSVTNTSNAALAVWGYFDAVVYHPTLEKHPSSGPFPTPEPFLPRPNESRSAIHELQKLVPRPERFVLRPNESRSAIHELQKLVPRDHTLDGTEVHEVWVKNSFKTYDDLSLKTQPELDSFDNWSSSSISFGLRRLLPTPPKFVPDETAVDASHVERVAEKCVHVRQLDVARVSVEGCITQSMQFAMELKNNRADPVYVSCPKTESNRWNVMAITSDGLKKSASPLDESDVLFLLREAQSLQMRHGFTDQVPLATGISKLVVVNRCRVYNWYEPTQFRVFKIFQFDFSPSVLGAN